MITQSKSRELAERFAEQLERGGSSYNWTPYQDKAHFVSRSAAILRRCTSADSASELIGCALVRLWGSDAPRKVAPGGQPLDPDAGRAISALEACRKQMWREESKRRAVEPLPADQPATTGQPVATAAAADELRAAISRMTEDEMLFLLVFTAMGQDRAEVMTALGISQSEYYRRLKGVARLIGREHP